jgi:small subunit ribosomal protein S1
MADTEDFAALFEASLKEKAKRIEQGQTIEGTIVNIGPDVAFVDVGGKGEAEIDVSELKDADGDIEVSVGDRIQAVVVSTAGGLKLSRRLARGAATRQQLEDAYRSGLAVEGRVEKEVKGGFEVKVAGQRAFCPFSQIDIARGTVPAQHLGKTYTFRISEYKEGGRNIIVSRRSLMEEEQRGKAAEIRQSIVPGAILTGTVASVRDFGAFIELGGGIQGLLHVSEMGWSRVANPAEHFTPGESITVKVLQVDEAKEKISLGLKQLMDDPWTTVQSKYSVGQVLGGRITRLAEFGAFVELEPGVEGLAHFSTFPASGRPNGWKQDARPGTAGTFEILSIDPEKKRIGVALVPEGSSRSAVTQKQIEEAEQAAEIREYNQRESGQSSGGFGGSLADKLKGALKK